MMKKAYGIEVIIPRTRVKIRYTQAFNTVKKYEGFIGVSLRANGFVCLFHTLFQTKEAYIKLKSAGYQLGRIGELQYDEGRKNSGDTGKNLPN